jgi:hypothetical protein
MTSSSFNYEDWQEKILAYINKKMDESERETFERNMAQTPELREAVEFDSMLKHKAQTHFLEKYMEANWDDLMKEAFSDEKSEDTSNQEPSQSIPPKTTNSYPLSIKWLLGILTTVAIITSFYFYYQYQQKQEILALIGTYEKDFFPHLNYTERNYPDNAINEYDKGKEDKTYYLKAEKLFEQEDKIPQKIENPIYSIYRSVNALMLPIPKTDLAISILEKRHNSGNEAYKSAAVMWYLVKGYLQKKEYSKAKLMLEKIIQLKNDYKEEDINNANQLLLLLNKL